MGTRRVALLSLHTSPLDQPGTGDGGGLNVYVLEVARRLAARGVQVDVFTRRRDTERPPVVELADGLAVHHVAAGPPQPVAKEELPDLLCSFLLDLESHLDAIGDRRDFDVVHAHYWLSGWVGRRLRERWGVPLVQSFHTLAKVKNAALAPGDRPEPALRLAGEAHIIEEADRIVVSTCVEARFLHREYGVSGARIAVVSPGVDLDIFTPGPRPAGPPRLLFVGRLQPLKGPDVAVRTLAQVRASVPGAQLTIVGGTSGSGAGRTGPDQLRGLAAELGVADAVTFLPARPQRALADLYRAADVVLVPSRSESFGLVALEAQACGTPVVAADVGGLRSVVAGGRLVAGHDPADHAAAVVAYLTDAELAARASAVGIHAARDANWERTVDGLLDVYEDVTSARLATGSGA